MKMPCDFIVVATNDIDIYHLNLLDMHAMGLPVGANCMTLLAGEIATVNPKKGPKMKMAQEVLRHCFAFGQSGNKIDADSVDQFDRQPISCLVFLGCRHMYPIAYSKHVYPHPRFQSQGEDIVGKPDSV